MNTQDTELRKQVDQLFYKELRGKTVTTDQEAILSWAERRLKPAVMALITKAREEGVKSELHYIRVAGIIRDGEIDVPMTMALRKRIDERLASLNKTEDTRSAHLEAQRDMHPEIKVDA